MDSAGCIYLFIHILLLYVCHYIKEEVMSLRETNEETGGIEWVR